MDEFSYLSVLISIILGLALAQLITGIGRLIQVRARVDLYWPSVVWACVLLVINVQSWWAMFALGRVREWTFLEFLVVLLHPLALYLLAALALPDVTEFNGAARINLKANYFNHSRGFFGAVMVTIAASLARPFAFGGRPAVADIVVQMLWFALAGAALVTRREGYHKLLAAVFPASLALYIGALFARL